MIDALFSVIKNEEQRDELSAFYSENKNRLYFIALSKLHNEFDAEDAVQEAFSRIADKPEKFFEIPPGRRIAYIDVIVRNIAVDIYNSKNKLSAEQFDEGTEVGSVSLEDDLFDKISRDEILGFVDGLPTLQRNVLMLHCILGLSLDETAQRLNISLTVANKRLMLARKSVKAFIDERGKNYE